MAWRTCYIFLVLCLLAEQIAAKSSNSTDDPTCSDVINQKNLTKYLDKIGHSPKCTFVKENCQDLEGVSGFLNLTLRLID